MKMHHRTAILAFFVGVVGILAAKPMPKTYDDWGPGGDSLGVDMSISTGSNAVSDNIRYKPDLLMQPIMTPGSGHEKSWTVKLLVDGATASVEITSRMDTHQRHYGLGQRISALEMAMFHRPLDRDSDYYLIGTMGQTIVTRLLQIPGVTELLLDSNGVDILIGDAFSWGEVEPRVLKTLQDTLSIKRSSHRRYRESAVTKIVVVSDPDEGIETFHFNRLLSTSPISSKEYSLGLAAKITDERGLYIARRICELEGVDAIRLLPYQITIVLQSDHRWSPQLRRRVKNRICSALDGRRVRLLRQLKQPFNGLVDLFHVTNNASVNNNIEPDTYEY